MPHLYGYVPYKQVEMTVGMKVNTYLSTIKDKIVTLQDGSRLISFLNRYAVVSLHKVPKLAYELSCVPLPEGVAGDQIRAAALMQLVIPIIDTFKRDIMHLITILESSKKYWELKRENQLPLTMYIQRWMGKTNKKLNDKIKILDAYLDQQFTNLGSLTLHLDTFNEIKNPHEQLVWMQQLCTIVIAAYPQSKLQPQITSYEQVVNMIILASKCATHYPKIVHHRIKPYLMPNNFNRYLAAWSTTIATLGTGALLAHEKKDDIKEGMQQAKKNIKTFSIEHYQRIKEAFLGNAQQEQQLQKKYKEILDKLHQALIPSQEIIVAPAVKDGKQEEGQHKPIFHNIDPKWKAAFTKELIETHAKNIDAHYFENVIVPMLFDLVNMETQMASTSTKAFATKLSEIDLSVGENLGISFEKLRQEAWKIWQGAELPKDDAKPTTKEKQLVQTVMRAASDPMHKVSTTTDTLAMLPNVGWLGWQVELWNIQKQTRIFRAILTSIPIYLVISECGKGLYALYKKLRDVASYDAIREALIDIALLLNIYKDALPSEMAIDDYGRFVYQLGLLADKQVMQLIPYEYRSSFASNIQFLESSTLSAAEKLNIIDLMYKRYPFLSHDVRSSAAKAA